MQTIKLACLIAVVVVLAACSTTSRQCPAYHFAGADRWVPGANGTTYRFVSKSGDVQEYELDIFYMSESYEGDLPYDTTSDVVCTLGRGVKLNSVDDSHGFYIGVSHEDKIENNLEEKSNIHPISITGGPYVSAGQKEEKAQYFLVYLTPPYDTSYSPTSSEHKYHSELAINGQNYTNVISISADDSKHQAESTVLSPYFVNQLVLARGHGLIQFERRDGTVFDLVTSNR